MYRGIYRIARCTAEITSIYPLTQQLCAGYACTGEPELTLRTEQADIDREREKTEKIPGSFPDDYLETLAVYRKLCSGMLSRGGVLFHGSAIAVDGNAYLFTAASGTGKSTHTRLWRQMLGDRAVMVNDDKPLLLIRPGEVLICGTPWNGKHNLGSNVVVPLKAICILERGQENVIREISSREMLPMLIQQSHRPEGPGALGEYLRLMNMLAEQMKFYRLQCRMDPEAARISYEKLTGRPAE